MDARLVNCVWTVVLVLVVLVLYATMYACCPAASQHLKLLDL